MTQLRIAPCGINAVKSLFLRRNFLRCQGLPLFCGDVLSIQQSREIGCKNDDCVELQNMSTWGASRVGSHLGAFRTSFQLVAGLVFAISLVACGGGTASTPASTGPTPPSCSGSAASVAPAAKAAVATASAQALSALSPQYFGMHIDVGAIATPPTLPWPAFGTSNYIPFGTIRMLSTETRWSDMDQGNGQYDFSTLDLWRTLYQQNEVGNLAGDYQIMFTIYSVPKYISSDPTDACAFNSSSGHPPGSCDPPTDVCADGTGTDAAFTNFVTALAQHVNSDSLPKIHYWEIWNEPNNTPFWSGTLPQLARMAQDARCVIVGTNCNSLTTYPATGIDPTSQMLTPPPVTTSDETNTALNSPSGWMTAYLQAGGGQYAGHYWISWLRRTGRSRGRRSHGRAVDRTRSIRRRLLLETDLGYRARLFVGRCNGSLYASGMAGESLPAAGWTWNSARELVRIRSYERWDPHPRRRRIGSSRH
jgi:hypothetical protein